MTPAILLLSAALAASAPPAACRTLKLRFDGGVQLPPEAQRFTGSLLSESQARCLEAIGAALAAKPDLQGVTVSAAHDPATKLDGLSRATSVKLALVSGGLPSARVSLVGLASGPPLELAIRTGSSAAAAFIGLAEGSAALMAAGSPLDVGAPVRVGPGGRVVVAFVRGGHVELRPGAEGSIAGPTAFELQAGEALVRGASLRTRLGVLTTGGTAELFHRNGGLVVVAHQGETTFAGTTIAVGDAYVVERDGTVRLARRLPMPARLPPMPAATGLAKLGLGAVSGAARYELAGALDPDFLVGARAGGALTPETAEVPRGATFVRARALDERGVPGAWSAVRAAP